MNLLTKFNKIYITILTLSVFLLLVMPKTLKEIKPDKFNLETAGRIQTLLSVYPNENFATYECSKTYDVDRIQGLLVFLYMQKKYDPTGLKISFDNPACQLKIKNVISDNMIDISTLTDEELKMAGMKPITPLVVYEGTARWWFKEKP